MRAVLGARLPRNEDARLLTGRAQFVDDVRLNGMLHVAFRRSEYAHARLNGVDVSAARARDGVVAVYTASDLGDYWKPGPLLVSPPPVPGLVFHPVTQVPLARDKVRHVGEPIAMVVATSRYLAEDAAEDIVVDAEPLEAVVDLERALAHDAPIIHEAIGSNLAAHAVQRKGDYLEAKAAGCAGDLSPLPLRPRCLGRDRNPRRGGCLGCQRRNSSRSGTRPRLRSRYGTDSPAMLGLLESQVRVIAPFIGGGFGPKIMMFYPEEVLLPWAAIRLGRPLKWIEDRLESFTGDHSGARPDPRRGAGGRLAGTASWVCRTASSTTLVPTTPTGSPSRSTASAPCWGNIGFRHTRASSASSSPTRHW